MTTTSTRPNRLVVVTVVALLASAACSADAPEPLQPAAAAPPAGTTRFVCSVSASGEPVRFAIDLPAAFATRGTEASGCAWAMTVRVGEKRDRYDTDVVVSLDSVGDGDPLQREYDDQRGDSVDDVRPTATMRSTT